MFDREPIRVLHLPEDLWFTDHHRVEGRCHSEDVSYCICVAMFVRDFVDRRTTVGAARAVQICAKEAMDPQDRIAWTVRRHDEIDPIACRHQDGLADLFARRKLAQGRAGILRGVALAHIERRGAMVHADKKNLQLSAPTPITPNNRNANPASALAAA